MPQSFKEKLAEAIAGLKSASDVPLAARPYLDVVIAETEQDLASPALGPRRGRSIFELHGGADGIYPELQEANASFSWLRLVRAVMAELPDYLPWRFVLQSERETPILDLAGVLCGMEARCWSGGSWKLLSIDKPRGAGLTVPFAVPVLDALSPEGWWLVDRHEVIQPLLHLGEPHFIKRKTEELCLLRVKKSSNELADRLSPCNPSFNRNIHLLALSGRAKPGFSESLAGLIDDALVQAPDLTVAEAVLREIWQSPSREMSEHFEEGRFFIAASTGYAERRLWVTEGTNVSFDPIQCKEGKDVGDDGGKDGPHRETKKSGDSDKDLGGKE